MCDSGPQRPSSTERCDFVSENQAEQLETKADTTRKCPILAPMSIPERRSRSGSIRSIVDDDDEEEHVRLSCDDRTDSGIDVSSPGSPLSRLCEKHGCDTLLQSSTNGSHHGATINIPSSVAKHPPSSKLVEDRISALLLSFEKVKISWQVAQGERPHPTTASCTELAGNNAREIPWQPRDQNNVNIGSSDRTHRAGGSNRNQSGQDHESFQAPPDDGALREHDIDVDPNQPASNEDFAGGYPCVYHRIGSIDPTPGCAWPRQYTSQLRGHHFHSNHPNGPFGCCSRCYETGRLVRTYSGLSEWRRFANRAEVFEHEKKCTRDICIEEACHNYDQVPSAHCPCSHGPRFSQQQIWRMWYRRAHSLSRNEGVPNYTSPSSQHLRLSSAALERTQSSPGSTRAETASSQTRAPRTNADISPLIADLPSSHHPMASSSRASALLEANVTREALARLAAGLLQRVQVTPCEPTVVFRRTCEQRVSAAERLQHDLAAISPEDADAIELLCSLVQECLRLMTTPVERTHATWIELSLSALFTLNMEMPKQPPPGWCHQRQDFAESSTSSSFDGAGMILHPQIDSGTHQQQQFLLHQYQQQPQAFGMTEMMGNSALDMPPPDNSFSSVASVAQVGGAFASESANFSSIGIDEHTAQQILGVPQQPYYAHQRLHSMNQPPTSMHNQHQLTQLAPSMDVNNFPISTENAYLRSRQGLVPTRLMPSDSDRDSGVFSTTLSVDHGMGGSANDGGKGRADEAPEDSMAYW